MTVIRPNSVSGINSITAQADEIKVFKSDGTQGGLIIGGANLNATSGISTILALNVTGNVSIAGTLTYQDVDYSYYLGEGYESRYKDIKKTSTIVCNHVSWLDPLISASRRSGKSMRQHPHADCGLP